MEYYIGKFDGDLKKYLFMFNDNDSNWIYIDLFNDYPDYITQQLVRRWLGFYIRKNTWFNKNVWEYLKIN